MYLEGKSKCAATQQKLQSVSLRIPRGVRITERERREQIVTGSQPFKTDSDTVESFHTWLNPLEFWENLLDIVTSCPDTLYIGLRGVYHVIIHDVFHYMSMESEEEANFLTMTVN